MAVDNRISVSSVMESIATGTDPGAADRTEAPRSRAGMKASSTKESHLPQSGHFPSHFGDWYPQFWQLNRVLEAFFTVPNRSRL
jgi:hypothetical protein